MLTILLHNPVDITYDGKAVKKEVMFVKQTNLIQWKPLFEFKEAINQISIYKSATY